MNVFNILTVCKIANRSNVIKIVKILPLFLIIVAIPKRHRPKYVSNTRIYYIFLTQVSYSFNNLYSNTHQQLIYKWTIPSSV